MVDDFFDRGEIIPDQFGQRWSIDIDWYSLNKRSLFTLVQESLCPKCRKRFKAERGEVAASDLFATIKDCCSQKEGFITGELPILESIFRIFLANGNQPLELNELRQQLGKWRGGDYYQTSVVVLSRLLHSDRYYGFRQVPD
jgi:hypothetical protein